SMAGPSSAVHEGVLLIPALPLMRSAVDRASAPLGPPAVSGARAAEPARPAPVGGTDRYPSVRHVTRSSRTVLAETVQSVTQRGEPRQRGDCVRRVEDDGDAESDPQLRLRDVDDI